MSCEYRFSSSSPLRRRSPGACLSFIYCYCHSGEGGGDTGREREERAAASIRKREEEVQKELSGHLYARDKERQQHRHHEAISNFQVRKSYLINIFKWTNYFFWAILKIE